MTRRRMCPVCERKPSQECGRDDRLCRLAWKAYHANGDHRRCLQFDFDCDVKPFLPKIIDEGQAALRESGDRIAVIAFEADGGLRLWGTVNTSKEMNRLRFKAYRHYGVRGLVAHGVVYLVTNDPDLPLI